MNLLRQYLNLKLKRTGGHSFYTRARPYRISGVL